MSAPLTLPFYALTAVFDFDTMHRRAGGDERPPKGGWYGHGDAHKNCPLGRCGNRPGAYSQGASPYQRRSGKITAWRKAQAAANRQYLEEYVYARPR